MNRLFFVVISFCFSLSAVFADACITGDMTVPHNCVNASCTDTTTIWVPRNTSGNIRAILDGQQSAVNVGDQNLPIPDYCNQPVLVWTSLSCKGLWTTKTINGWIGYTGKIYRVIAGKYYLYNNGTDLLNQRTAKSGGPNNPLQIVIGNTCTTSACTATQEQSYSVFYSTPIACYVGSVSTFTMQWYDTPVITSLYVDNSRKTNSTFLYGASFTDRVPQWCTNTTYTYHPKVLTWNGGTVVTEFTDSNTAGNTHITINKTGESVTGNIAESITLGQIGLRKIQMNITDAWNNLSTLNTGMMEVIQWDVNQNNSSIVSSQNTSTKYYPGDTLIYTIVLKDAAGNIIKDKPAIFSHPTQDSAITYLDTRQIYSDANTGEYVLRISISRPLSFVEAFHVSLPYWDDQGIDITTGSPQGIDLSTGARIAIRDPNLAASDFAISCSQGPITLQATCVRDNLSWCNSAWNESITFNSESDNGAEWLLRARDNAGNIKQYKYIMNHIDKTPPTGILKLGNVGIINNKPIFANNSHLTLVVGDVSPVWCAKDVAYTLYRPTSTWPGVYNFAGSVPAWRTLDFGTTNFIKSGAGRMGYTLTDAAGNSVAAYRDMIVNPGLPSGVQSSIALVSPSRHSLYADNSSSYTYKLTLRDAYGNAIYGKRVNGINQEWGPKTIKTDMTNPNAPAGNDAVIESWVGGVNTTDNNGDVFFTVKSPAPGVFSEKFKIAMNGWWEDYVDTGALPDLFIDSGETNSFRKTFIGALSVTTSPYNLSIGTMLTMMLTITPTVTLSSYEISQFRDQIQLADSVNHEIQNMTDPVIFNTDTPLRSGPTPPFTDTPNPTTDFRINAKTDRGVRTAPGISIKNNPIISYTLGGEVIQYRLSATDSASDSVDIHLGWTQMNSLKVAGNLQGQGKQTLASQAANFSDISKSNTRAIVRKNAYLLIKGRASSETVVGGVKYHEGDYTLSWDPTYETLVVKNGNLKIAGNFNTGGKKFGIIVLRDDATRSDLGNIYIQPSVRYIQSAIYADGGIISTGFKSGEDTVGSYKDSATRTNTLSEQLVIKGSLFTRNTIGWAIKGSSGKYVVPGGSSTNDFNSAMMYDLNYLRWNNQGYNTSGTNGSKDYNQGNKNNVVIIFDANLQKNPPKGFKN